MKTSIPPSPSPLPNRAPLGTRLFEALPKTSWSSVGFAVRTTVASLIALYIAFLIDLDDPKWAAMTVWIVAQGSRGMSVSKGQYRIAGTAIGAVVAITLIAVFSQTPGLFVVALAVWLGLCTGVATALRNFRAYGAVLAGYTAAIIGMDSVAAPEHVFDIAVARVIYILLGIIVEAVLTALLAPGTPLNDAQARLGGYIRQAAATCARALRGEANGVALHRLFASAVDLDAFAEYAAAGSADVRHKLGHLRAATAATLAQLAAAQSLREYLARGSRNTVGSLIDETQELLETIAAASADKLPAVVSLLDQVEEAFSIEAKAVRESPSLELLLLDRLHALLTSLHEALVRQALLRQKDSPPSRLGFSFHIDPVTAVHNGVRSFLAVLAASACWIFTAWPSGPGFVTIVCVVCALFATRANAVAGGLGFLKGAAWAAVAAGFCDFVLLPAVSDFPMLALIAAFFMLGAGLAMRQPRTAASGASFAIFFWDLISPQNTSRIDATAFFNGALSLLIGMACGTVIFALVFPANPRATRTRLQRAVRSDLSRICHHPVQGSSEGAWLTRTADRLGRQLAASGSTADEQAEKEIRGMLAAWAIGNAAVALHGLAARHAPMQKPVAAVLRRLGDSDPVRLARVSRAYAGWLTRQARQQTNRQAPGQAAAQTESSSESLSNSSSNSQGQRPAHTANNNEGQELLHGAVLLLTIAQAATAHADFLKG
jgi:uncharacterized membrane protein YccC